MIFEIESLALTVHVRVDQCQSTRHYHENRLPNFESRVYWLSSMYVHVTSRKQLLM